jgi:hypothetical protein
MQPRHAPSFPQTTASPSMITERAWSQRTASTISGNRWLQLKPRVYSRTRSLSRRTDQPVPVVLDLVDPLQSSRRSLRVGGKARKDKHHPADSRRRPAAQWLRMPLGCWQGIGEGGLNSDCAPTTCAMAGGMGRVPTPHVVVPEPEQSPARIWRCLVCAVQSPAASYDAISRHTPTCELLAFHFLSDQGGFVAPSPVLRDA